MGERLNGIQEVRGSIPLASMAFSSGVKTGGFEGRVEVWRWQRVAAAGIAQLVEHNLAKVGVAGSSPVSRSSRMRGRRRGRSAISCPREEHPAATNCFANAGWAVSSVG